MSDGEIDIDNLPSDDDENLDDIEINLDELSSGEISDDEDEAMIKELKAKEEERQKQEALIRELAKRTRTRLIQKRDTITNKPQSREKSNKIIKRTINSQFKYWIDVKWNNDLFWTKMLEDLNLILDVIEDFPVHTLKIYHFYLVATKKYEPWKTFRKEEKNAQMKKFLLNYLARLRKVLIENKLDLSKFPEYEEIDPLFDELIICDYWLYNEKDFYEVLEYLKGPNCYRKPVEQKCSSCNFSSIDSFNFCRCLDCHEKAFCRSCVKTNMHLDNSTGRRCLNCKETANLKTCEKCGYVMSQYYWTHHFNNGRCFCLRNVEAVAFK